MLGQHLEYDVWKVNYDRPFMDYMGRKKDWAIFIVFVLPEEVTVYTLFGEKASL